MPRPRAINCSQKSHRVMATPLSSLAIGPAFPWSPNSLLRALPKATLGYGSSAVGRRSQCGPRRCSAFLRSPDRAPRPIPLELSCPPRDRSCSTPSSTVPGSRPAPWPRSSSFAHVMLVFSKSDTRSTIAADGLRVARALLQNPHRRITHTGVPVHVRSRARSPPHVAECRLRAAAYAALCARKSAARLEAAPTSPAAGRSGGFRELHAARDGKTADGDLAAPALQRRSSGSSPS